MLTHARLLELLEYHPAEGLFLWRLDHGKMKAGTVAGHRRSDGYWKIGIDYKEFFIHRLAYFYIHKKWPTRTDHRDRKPDNNRLGNIREATQSQNMVNVKAHRDSKSGVRGVYRHRKAYVAQITKDGINFYLGSFSTSEAAAEAWKNKAKELFGEFAP